MTSLSGGSAGSADSGRRSVSPSARASASETPGRRRRRWCARCTGRSPPRSSRCTARPLGVVAATECTGLNSSGWWVSTQVRPPGQRLLDHRGSRVDGEQHPPHRRAGSPHTSPTASQSRAQEGSYICSSTVTTSARVAVGSLVTARTLAATPRVVLTTQSDPGTPRPGPAQTAHFLQLTPQRPAPAMAGIAGDRR